LLVQVKFTVDELRLGQTLRHMKTFPDSSWRFRFSNIYATRILRMAQFKPPPTKE